MSGPAEGEEKSGHSLFQPFAPFGSSLADSWPAPTPSPLGPFRADSVSSIDVAVTTDGLSRVAGTALPYRSIHDACRALHQAMESKPMSLCEFSLELQALQSVKGSLGDHIRRILQTAAPLSSLEESTTTILPFSRLINSSLAANAKQRL